MLTNSTWSVNFDQILKRDICVIRINFEMCLMNFAAVLKLKCFSSYNLGTIIRTGTACKKIPSYTNESTCRWCIDKKIKIF